MSSRVQIDGEAVALLSKLLLESDLTEIEYKQGETHIRVAKQVSVVQSPYSSSFPPSSAPALPLSGQEGGTLVPPLASDEIVVKSPMVGTAYRSSDPAAAPFVQVGTNVKAGDILLIVEAMKVMNPIRAPQSGTVKAICVENGAPVEYDQILVQLV